MEKCTVRIKNILSTLITAIIAQFLLVPFAFTRQIVHAEDHTVTHSASPSAKTAAHASTGTAPAAHTHTTAAGKSKTATADHASLQPSTKAFSSSVSKYFDLWTTGRRELTAADLSTLLKNSDIHGQDAAALAAIAARLNGLTTWDPHTLASINQKLTQNGLPAFSERDHAVTVKTPYCTITLNPVPGSKPQTYTTRIRFTKQQLTAAINAPSSPLYADYKAALGSIVASTYSNGSFKLYGSSNAPPPLSAIRQWRDGDCYLVSSIGSLLVNDPGALQKMISPVKDSKDEYLVKFPGYPTTITVKLTKAEVGMYSHVEGGGAWLAILSVAEAKVRDPHDTNPMSIIHGGQQTQVLSLLTKQTYVGQPITGDDANLKQTLTGSINKAALTSPTNLQIPIGIETSGHALLITGYNPETGMVTIWNPWGTTGLYYPVPGGKTKFNMVNGQFTVPIADLAQDGFVKVSVPAAAE